LVDVQDQYEKEGQAKEQQLQAVLPKSEDRQESVLSPQEAWAMRQQLLGVFDIVRLVDPTANREVIIDEDGGIHPKNNGCYCVWNRTSRCENCVSAKCVCTHTHIDKFEFVNDEIYYVMAHYLEVGGHPYAMEMVSRVTDETILCGHGREKLVESITEHNRKLYIDPVAGVYNRRYYEEQLAQMHQTNAVAMMDLDNFKSINDSYGHQVGDLALRQVAQAISSCVRKSDAVVRYGGDEFVVIFQDIPRGVFERKLEAIRHAVSNLAVPEIPGMRLEISVGGGYGIGSISELVRMADEKMYDSKRLKKEQEGGQSPV
jgi:putative two-component system response regulator